MLNGRGNKQSQLMKQHLRKAIVNFGTDTNLSLEIKVD